MLDAQLLSENFFARPNFDDTASARIDQAGNIHIAAITGSPIENFERVELFTLSPH